MDVVAEVYVRRARDFVVKFAVDFACLHRSELPPTACSPSNTVLAQAVCTHAHVAKSKAIIDNCVSEREKKKKKKKREEENRTFH